MRKFVLILLAFLVAFSAAAESDVAAMSTDDLVSLRDAINHELAQRSQSGEDIQVVDVDGMLISIDSVYVGTGRDDAPAICVLFNITNTADKSYKAIDDLGCDILQNGVPLENSFFRSDSYNGPSAIDSSTTVIAPGLSNVKICEVGIMTSESDDFNIILSRKHTHAGEDPYCGMFSFHLSDYIQ